MSNFDFGKKLSEKKMKSRTTCEGNIFKGKIRIFSTLCSVSL
jgi:hypothetical protein